MYIKTGIGVKRKEELGGPTRLPFGSSMLLLYSVRVRILSSSVLSLSKDAASRLKACLSYRRLFCRRWLAQHYPLPLGPRRAPQQQHQLMYANMSVSEGGTREGGTHMKLCRARDIVAAAAVVTVNRKDGRLGISPRGEGRGREDGGAAAV